MSHAPVHASLSTSALAERDPHLARLFSLLSEMGSVLVCYSGGVDSAFVLAAAHRVLGGRAVGMTAVSPSLPSFEREAAIDIARHIGARHELVASGEIEDDNYRKNDVDRCFHCKSELYRLSAKKKTDWAMAWVANGTNLDDLGDYRPGLEAAKNAEVRSVLVECGFRKEDVRRGAELLGLPVWNKPASACLSSRIPYGTEVTRERLAQIDAFEAELRRLGLRQVRVRWHGLGSAPTREATAPGAIARIEVDTSELARAFELRETLVEAGKRCGFRYVTLDLQGYRTGSHNEVLSGRSLRVVS
ncbi:MAG TPA: ATP-dependent sacrificial sulfur transferase LarE [Polyangiaceae bacterium]|nr:ATP-dependent sacrificial sulfur transferase LarE [Polyangiaceae bacterium]